MTIKRIFFLLEDVGSIKAKFPQSHESHDTAQSLHFLLLQDKVPGDKELRCSTHMELGSILILAFMSFDPG